MTIQYDPQRSIFLSAFAWRNTAIRTVIVEKREFWLYVGLHVGFVALTVFTDMNTDFFEWDLLVALQYVLAFILLVYNENCYQRYLAFYPFFMNIMHSTMLFVFELTVSFPSHMEEVQPHRRAACRYILAAEYLFFMTESGSMQPGAEWLEVQRKGLLSKAETEMLQDYPGGRVTLILCSWAMQVIHDALTKRCFWRPRSMSASHCHDRFNVYTCDIIKSCHSITYLHAMPLPFPYYHIVNFVIFVNLLTTAFAFATFKSFFSVLPFGISVLICMTFQEVSVALSCPFSQDVITFPIHDFLDHAFDHSVSLLEVFSHPEAFEGVVQQIRMTEPFTDTQLLRPCKEAVIHNPPSKRESFDWQQPTPLQRFDDNVDQKQFLLQLFVNGEGNEGDATNLKKASGVKSEAPTDARRDHEQGEKAPNAAAIPGGTRHSEAAKVGDQSITELDTAANSERLALTALQVEIVAGRARLGELRRILDMPPLPSQDSQGLLLPSLPLPLPPVVSSAIAPASTATPKRLAGEATRQVADRDASRCNGGGSNSNTPREPRVPAANRGRAATTGGISDTLTEGFNSITAASSFEAARSRVRNALANLTPRTEETLSGRGRAFVRNER
eukprot:TRINITY_DN34218_c0_g1_i1.p1 TRINITY_DN34218_c0_g1~~TRINITY_DN34218_c0_g1_i1.p1  ORF type:complete len:633 (+),score=100.57 TRINITY_DN34218_c0_g1_i1:55-1899(+)